MPSLCLFFPLLHLSWWSSSFDFDYTFLGAFLFSLFFFLLFCSIMLITTNTIISSIHSSSGFSCCVRVFCSYSSVRLSLLELCKDVCTPWGNRRLENPIYSLHSTIHSDWGKGRAQRDKGDFHLLKTKLERGEVYKIRTKRVRFPFRSSVVRISNLRFAFTTTLRHFDAFLH